MKVLATISLYCPQCTQRIGNTTAEPTDKMPVHTTCPDCGCAWNFHVSHPKGYARAEYEMKVSPANRLAHEYLRNESEKALKKA